MINVIPQGTVTSPQGFLAGSTSAGIKSKSKELDLGLLFSRNPCTAAGVFTQNKVKAAPVLLSMETLKKRQTQAVVVNSGCANAGTGEKGMEDAREMVSLAARKLGIPADKVFVASTGVIGVNIPVDKVRSGLENIKLSPGGGYELARAIMTTDAWPKERAVEIEIDGHRCIIGGIAKGAGMIHPNLATLLVFLTTDAAVEANFLQTALKKAVDASFNMVTVDGDTSTNDSVIILANGLAGNKAITRDTPNGRLFQRALEEVCVFLARSVACNAEGASHLIEIKVEGAISQLQARRAARTIAGSNLVKTAVHGADPNWGRILAAVGRSEIELDENKIDIYIGDICLMKGGKPQTFDKNEAQDLLRKMVVGIRVGVRVRVNPMCERFMCHSRKIFLWRN
ncbi:MAG: ornithine acetyltransferase [Dehalococcoidia bacterium]|nr:ornithine acetyltransferase [Dehalococcoidia bacterium]